MIEIVLILGVLFVLGVVVLTHIGTNASLNMIEQESGFPQDPSINHIFFVVESVLILVLLYLFKNIS